MFTLLPGRIEHVLKPRLKCLVGHLMLLLNTLMLWFQTFIWHLPLLKACEQLKNQSCFMSTGNINLVIKRVMLTSLLMKAFNRIFNVLLNTWGTLVLNIFLHFSTVEQLWKGWFVLHVHQAEWAMKKMLKSGFKCIWQIIFNPLSCKSASWHKMHNFVNIW